MNYEVGNGGVGDGEFQLIPQNPKTPNGCIPHLQKHRQSAVISDS
jgi:hypothetical protein